MGGERRSRQHGGLRALQLPARLRERPRRLGAAVKRRPLRALAISGAAGLLAGALLAGLVWAVPVTADRNDKRDAIDELRGPS